jgi:hypothetical protein
LKSGSLMAPGERVRRPRAKICYVLGVPADAACPTCGRPTLHHSQPRTWIERLRRRVTSRVPFRCHTCQWRGWRREPAQAAAGLREIHRALTDSELARLEPDNPEGDRM